MAYDDPTFVIEIPAELRLTEEETALLEGHFKTDVTVMLQARTPTDDPPHDETNVNQVHVTSRVRTAAAARGGSGGKSDKAARKPRKK